MAPVSSISTISQVFSKLGDNTGSVIPMFVKDFTSNTMTSVTYYKEGGKMDGPEKTLEEFGTGVVWLGGIPFIKKHVFDSRIFKKYDINPDIDANRLFSGNNKEHINTLEFAADKAKSLGKEFEEQAGILDKTIKNKSLAKNLALTKFIGATAATGAALYGIITLKQKNTEKQIKKELDEKHKKAGYEKNAIKNTSVYQIFKGKNNPENQNDSSKGPSFKGGLGTFVMTNPIANTAIVDCVIAGTRMKQAREGEMFEILFKEASVLAFIYGLAQPLQKGFEALSMRFLKKPIETDYAVMDSKAVKEAMEQEKVKSGSSKLMQDAKAIINLALGKGENTENAAASIADKAKQAVKSSDIKNEDAKKVLDFIFNNQDSDIVDVFKKSGNLSTFKTKQGVEQLSLLSSISVKSLKETAENTVKLLEEGSKSKDVTSFLKKTKFAKGAAIIGNIGISALLIGYAQPKLNLYFRKKRNDGNNTNPAILAIEKEYEANLKAKSFQTDC